MDPPPSPPFWPPAPADLSFCWAAAVATLVLFLLLSAWLGACRSRTSLTACAPASRSRPPAGGGCPSCR